MPGFLEVRMEGKQEHFSGKVTAESDPDKLGPKIARHLGAASIDDVVLRSTEPADKNAVVDLAEEVATVQKKLAADPIGLISHTLVLLATLGACLRPAAAALPAAAPDGPAAPAQRAAVPDAAAAPPSSKGDADAGTAGKAGGKDSKRKSDGSAAASKDPADTWTKTFLEYLPDFIPRGLDSKFLTVRMCADVTPMCDAAVPLLAVLLASLCRMVARHQVAANCLHAADAARCAYTRLNLHCRMLGAGHLVQTTASHDRGRR